MFKKLLLLLTTLSTLSSFAQQTNQNVLGFNMSCKMNGGKVKTAKLYIKRNQNVSRRTSIFFEEIGDHIVFEIRKYYNQSSHSLLLRTGKQVKKYGQDSRLMGEFLNFTYPITILNGSTSIYSLGKNSLVCRSFVKTL